MVEKARLNEGKDLNKTTENQFESNCPYLTQQALKNMPTHMGEFF
jgi:hypothetical protein